MATGDGFAPSTSSSKNWRSTAELPGNQTGNLLRPLPRLSPFRLFAGCFPAASAYTIRFSPQNGGATGSRTPITALRTQRPTVERWPRTGLHGRICTFTKSLGGTYAICYITRRNWSPWQDLHPQQPGSRPGASANWATWGNRSSWRDLHPQSFLRYPFLENGLGSPCNFG